MSSMVTCCLGLLFFPIVLFGLGWNEQRAACENNAIIYTQTKATPVSCTVPANSGTIAFIMCPLQNLPVFTLDALNQRMAQTDFANSVQIPGASVAQTAEMFQCVQSSTSTTQGSGNNKQTITTYSYRMSWVQNYVDTSRYATSSQAIQARSSQCPGVAMAPLWPTNVEQGVSTNYHQTVNAGVYKVTNTLMKSSYGTGLPPNQAVDMSQFAPNFATLATMRPPPGATAYSLTNTNMAVQGTYLVSCSTTQIGCMRLSFMANGATSVAAVASIGSAGETEPIRIPAFWGCKARDFQASWGLKGSSMSLNDVVASMQSDKSVMTWLLRITGLVLAWITVYCCLSPITAATDVFGDCIRNIPCVGGFLESILEGAVQCLVCAISCSTGCSCGLFVIAMVWVVMRPLIGGLMMGGALVVLIAGWFIAHSMSGNNRVANKGSQSQKLRQLDDNYSGSEDL